MVRRMCRLRLLAGIDLVNKSEAIEEGDKEDYMRQEDQ